MPQNLLPFQYKTDPIQSKLTALGGLPLFLDLMRNLGGIDSLRSCLDKTSEFDGWSHSDVVLSLVMLNLAGGDCVEDLEQLNVDLGFSKIMKLVQQQDISRQQKRFKKRKLTKLKMRRFPSTSSAFRRLEDFHDPKQEKEKNKQRQKAEITGKGKAYIQQPNQKLMALIEVNRRFVESIALRAQLTAATLDQDATLIETHKEEALFCYKKFKAYQPLNTYWAELGVVLHSEFRDGNVPAGYQIDLLKYCAQGLDKRFGVIEFAVAIDVCDEFRQAALDVPDSDWKPLIRDCDGLQIETGQEWAEVCYVPNWVGHTKRGPEYRFVAILRSNQSARTLRYRHRAKTIFISNDEDRTGEKLRHI